MLAIWQTFAARIQNHPKVGGSLVLLETGSRKFHQVSPSLQGISAVPYAMIFREIYIYIYSFTDENSWRINFYPRAI